MPTSEPPSGEEEREDSTAWRIVNAVYDERAALAEELHQGVQQNLAALLIRLSSMGETADRDDMCEIRELVTQTLNAMRTSIKPLVPAAQHLGLAAALNELSEILEQHAGIHLSVPNCQERRYPRAVELVAYDIVRILLTSLTQEGLRHASVSLHEGPGSLRLFVELHDFCKSLVPLEARLRGALEPVRGRLAVELEAQSTAVVCTFPRGAPK